MASNVQQEFEHEMDETTNGHNIHYSFNVKHLVIRESWPLVVEFFVDCATRSTRWKLEVTYEQDADTGKISAHVALTRTDPSNDSLATSIRVVMLNEKEECLRQPVEICSNDQMGTDETIQGRFEDSREPGFRGYVLSLEFTFRVIIFVRSCHFHENFDRDVYIRKVLSMRPTRDEDASL